MKSPGRLKILRKGYLAAHTQVPLRIQQIPNRLQYKHHPDSPPSRNNPPTSLQHSYLQASHLATSPLSPPFPPCHPSTFPNLPPHHTPTFPTLSPHCPPTFPTFAADYPPTFSARYPRAPGFNRSNKHHQK